MSRSGQKESVKSMLRHYCNLVSIVLISLKSMRAENVSGDDRRGSGSRLGIFAEQKKDSKKDFLMFFNITTFLCITLGR